MIPIFNDYNNCISRLIIKKNNFKMDITKEEFEKFERLQKSSKINMTDIVNGSKLIRISEKKYEEILFNYTELKIKFK